MKRKSGKASSAKAEIENAAKALIARCDEIVAAAEAGKDVSDLFTPREITVSNRICIDLALAVANSESADEIAAHRELFIEMERHVMAANAVIAARTASNEYLMNAVRQIETTVLGMLIAADPTVRILSGFAAKHLSIVSQTLTAAYTGIYDTLVESEGRPQKRRAALARCLANPLGSVVAAQAASVLRRYGKDFPSCTDDVIAFICQVRYDRSLKLPSLKKACEFIRSCSDPKLQLFAACSRVNAYVTSYAKRTGKNVDTLWRSLCQLAKPSELAQRAKRMAVREKSSAPGPVPIPDRSWCGR